MVKIVTPSVRVVFHYPTEWEEPDHAYGITFDQLEHLEKCGRICYKSEDKITEGSDKKFVSMLKRKQHLSVIEHCVATAWIVAPISLTRELIRHRLASFSEQSTRYCNYGKDKFGGIGVIQPPFKLKGSIKRWRHVMNVAEEEYLALVADGEPPELARSVLPLCLKTEIVMTANLRQWMHVFEMRCAPSAHPEIRALMTDAREQFRIEHPELFGEPK